MAGRDGRIQCNDVIENLGRFVTGRDFELSLSIRYVGSIQAAVPNMENALDRIEARTLEPESRMNLRAIE